MFQDYNPDEIKWPDWISHVTSLSHFLLTFACSANFFIYYAKHGQAFSGRNKRGKANGGKPLLSEATVNNGVNGHRASTRNTVVLSATYESKV